MITMANLAAGAVEGRAWLVGQQVTAKGVIAPVVLRDLTVAA